MTALVVGQRPFGEHRPGDRRRRMRGRDDARAFVGKRSASASLSPGNRDCGSQRSPHRRHGSYCAWSRHLATILGPNRGWSLSSKEPRYREDSGTHVQRPSQTHQPVNRERTGPAAIPPILARNAPKITLVPHDAETETRGDHHLRQRFVRLRNRKRSANISPRPASTPGDR